MVEPESYRVAAAWMQAQSTSDVCKSKWGKSGGDTARRRGEANRHRPHFHHGPLELASLLALVTLLMAVAINLLLKHGFHSRLEVCVSFL